MGEITSLEVIIRLLVSAGLGALIGLERESKSHPAGLRTNAILCTGSALIMIVSYKIALGWIHLHDSPADPGRIAAQVVSGIGFLGAGAILRMGLSIKGLTTAATIWTVAGIGLATGAGYYHEAIFCTGVVLCALLILNWVERRYSPRKRGDKRLTISAFDNPNLLGMIAAVVQKHSGEIASVEFSRNSYEGRVELQARLKLPNAESKHNLLQEIQNIPGIQEVEFA